MHEKVSIHSAGLAIAMNDDGVSHPQYIVPSNRQHSNFATKPFFWGGDKVDSVECKCLIPTYTIKMRGLQTKGTISS